MQVPSYETLFRLSPHAAALLDAQGCVLDINQAYLQLLGRPLVHLRGVSLDELVAASAEAGLEADALSASFRRACAQGAPDAGPAGGQWRVDHVPLFDEVGTRVAVLQTLQSSPVEAVAAAEAGERGLRLQAVGRLASGVAHAFNNVLQVIGGNLQLLRRQLRDDLVAQRRLDSALEGVERGGRLASQLLGFSSRAPGEAGPVRLGERVESLLDLLTAVLGQGVDVRLEVSPALWPVLADTAALEDVLLELAAQAREVLQGRGHLCLRLDNRRLDEARGDGGAGDYVVLSFEDQGASGGVRDLYPVGAPPAVELEGAQALAARLGGFVLSGRRRGSLALELFIPRGVSERSPAAPADAPAPTHRSEGLRVLFVEDDPTLRMLTGEVMAELGHEVVLGETAEEALSQLASGSFDVLFTDIGLPGMDGLELARQARARYPGLEVVIASGYMVDAAAERLDGVHCVLKPYDIERVRLMLEGIAGRRTV